MHFFDTSCLFKKYFLEEGSKDIMKLFSKNIEVAVAPITYVELINTFNRYAYEKIITAKELSSVTKNVNDDFKYFQRIVLGEAIESLCFAYARKYRLKSMDLIQLASAKHSKSSYFLTSDKQLFKVAQKEFKKTKLI